MPMARMTDFLLVRHLESASGILALTKAILMVQRGYILPTADFEQLGPTVEGIEKLKVSQRGRNGSNWK